MKECMITFRSVTPAQRAQGALRRAGIRCDLGRTPRRLQELGCGYSLWVTRQEVLASVTVLKNQAIDYGKVYVQQEQDRLQELVL